jgi:hypothetical protein
VTPLPANLFTFVKERRMINVIICNLYGLRSNRDVCCIFFCVSGHINNAWVLIQISERLNLGWRRYIRIIGTELNGDYGWHPINPTFSYSMNPNGLPSFMEDADPTGIIACLLNDFLDAGYPAKSVQYDLVGPTDINKTQILTGKSEIDDRVFYLYGCVFLNR